MAGWNTSYKDAHGRMIKTGKGPDRVTNIAGSHTLHPPLFRCRIRALMSNNNRPSNTLTRAEVDTAFTPTLGHPSMSTGYACYTNHYPSNDSTATSGDTQYVVIR